MSHAWLVLWMAMAAASSPKRHVIALREFQFQPAVVNAAVGDTIIWRNEDMVPHTADADDRAWRTGHIDGKAERRTVIRQKGRHAFTCLYHSNMKGTLVVK